MVLPAWADLHRLPTWSCAPANAASLEPRITFETKDTAPIIRHRRSGMGVALIPYLALVSARRHRHPAAARRPPVPATRPASPSMSHATGRSAAGGPAPGRARAPSRDSGSPSPPPDAQLPRTAPRRLADDDRRVAGGSRGARHATAQQLDDRRCYERISDCASTCRSRSRRRTSTSAKKSSPLGWRRSSSRALSSDARFRRRRPRMVTGAARRRAEELVQVRSVFDARPGRRRQVDH